ncbi:hypothetical protein ASD47_16135 [Caulobacter sp. Root1472]|nr:hypothetical protein ASD47_16135 [Caulobacter sp. Root1472]
MLHRLRNYIEIERPHAVSKFRARKKWMDMEHPIFCRSQTLKHMEIKSDEGQWRQIATRHLRPGERMRMILCNQDGDPQEPAIVWLTETGLPLELNSWEVAFRRAADRCNQAGAVMHVHPHKLRHTFAVHMLLMLRARLEMEWREVVPKGYGSITEEPLRTLQRLLGHASISTTERYAGPANEMLDVLPEDLVRFVNLLTETHT